MDAEQVIGIFPPFFNHLLHTAIGHVKLFSLLRHRRFFFFIFFKENISVGIFVADFLEMLIGLVNFLKCVAHEILIRHVLTFFGSS